MSAADRKVHASGGETSPSASSRLGAGMSEPRPIAASVPDAARDNLDDAAPELQLSEITRRRARFAETQDPEALWPGLDEPTRRAAVQEVGRVTRAVLAGARAVAIALDHPRESYALGVAGHITGMGPLLGRWLEDGALTAKEPTRARLANHLAHGRRRAQRIEDEVVPALDALLDLGITPVALKGAHTAHVYFEERGARRMSDVDLLIPPDRVADVERALERLGYAPQSPAEHPYKRDWLAPGVDARLYSVEWQDARSVWTLELHSSLDRVYHPGAVAPLDSERDVVVSCDYGGRPLRALAPPLLLAMLACHASQELDGSRLLRLVEIVRVARGFGHVAPVDWDEVLAVLERTGTARFAYPALALAEELAPGTVDPRALALGREQSTWAARHTVDALSPDGGSLDARGLLRQSMWTRSPLAVANRIARSLWPATPGGGWRGWQIRLRRWRQGLLSLRAPDERNPR